MPERRVCLVPRVSGVGGMVSFQDKLEAGLAQRGVLVSHDLRDAPYQAILVIGGTSALPGLWQARRSGIPIVQRLDGMNWLHKKHPPGAGRGGLRHYLRAEYGNLVLATIRRRLATHLVYQSRFVQDWWERRSGPAGAQKTVIVNGVDLEIYTPDGEEQPPSDFWRLLMVEGSLMGGYEQGLAVGISLVETLSAAAAKDGLKSPVELMVVGRVAPELQERWSNYLEAHSLMGNIRLNWAGLVRRESIPALDRSAHLLYSADINAACPNSVIEALACGLPVISFNTGALPELVPEEAGRIVPFGGDPWNLDFPDVDALARAAREVLASQAHFRLGARRTAEENYGLDRMVDAYLEVMFQ